MTQLWKSADVPAAQRADAVREAVGTRLSASISTCPKTLGRSRWI